MPRRTYSHKAGRRRPRSPGANGWDWLAEEIQRRHARPPSRTRPNHQPPAERVR